LSRVEHAAITWFAEDEKLLGPHPKDPYKRIETFPSSRTIRVEVDGVVVAESCRFPSPSSFVFVPFSLLSLLVKPFGHW